MTGPVRCTAFGHRIATDLVIPGAMADDGGRPPEIVIRRFAPRRGDEAAGTSLWREGAVLELVLHGIAGHRFTTGSIDVAPCPGADDDEVAALLIATALPGLLRLRGGFRLHASAAVVPGQDRAVAVSAPSGAGKSAVLSALVERDARATADDSVSLRATAAALSASGLPGGYFSHHPDPGARPFVPIDPRRTVTTAPLGAIPMLSRHAAREPATFRRLAPFETLAGILSQRHRPAITALCDDPGARLADAVRVARTPTYRWSRPEGQIGLTDAEWQTIAGLSGGEGDG